MSEESSTDLDEILANGVDHARLELYLQNNPIKTRSDGGGSPFVSAGIVSAKVQQIGDIAMGRTRSVEPMGIHNIALVGMADFENS
ncbi:hypothetical protein AVEN_9700-1 [Araneus ventricosus]|uniref:Uncharacterized protein n=1 Tax=Araneus ventricosus TaxID=182803 RepID=A0A4Y2DW72_ARAVE|nr:hypothetical protein AVEN_9700-1 [Araneus ventricosus]